VTNSTGIPIKRTRPNTDVNHGPRMGLCQFRGEKAPFCPPCGSPRVYLATGLITLPPFIETGEGYQSLASAYDVAKGWSLFECLGTGIDEPCSDPRVLGPARDETPTESPQPAAAARRRIISVGPPS
jgi:hypothetical protein